MSHKETKMKPIWFLVGLLLLINGVLIFASGIYYFFNPNHYRTVLAHLYPSIWWGAVILLVGGIMLIASRKATED